MTNIECIAYIIALMIIIGGALFGMFMMYAFVIIVGKIIHIIEKTTFWHEVNKLNQENKAKKN